jgi:hypothetical protein
MKYVNNLKKLLQFIELCPERFFLSLLRFYALKMENLDLFFPWVDFEIVSRNQNIIWDMQHFLKYKDKMGFDYLPDQEEDAYGCCRWWIPELYEKHPEYYLLNGFPTYDYWVWDATTIHLWAPVFNTYTDWNEDDEVVEYPAWRALCSNEKVQWTPALLEQYQDKLDWGTLSKYLGLAWSEDEILPFEDRWYWNGLAENRNIIWTEKMYRKHERAIFWPHYTYYGSLIADPKLFIENEQHIKWSEVHNNPHIRWDQGLLQKYMDRLNWAQISACANPFFPWSEDFISQHADKIHFGLLSGNPHPGIPWSEDFILQYLNQWDMRYLPYNQAIPWTETLIDTFIQRREDAITLNQRICENTATHWSPEFLEKYKDKWAWDGLMKNPAVPWDHDLLLHFAPDMDLSSSQGQFSQEFWDRLFAPYLTDKLVLEILEEITPRLPRLNDLAV